MVVCAQRGVSTVDHAVAASRRVSQLLFVHNIAQYKQTTRNGSPEQKVHIAASTDCCWTWCGIKLNCS